MKAFNIFLGEFEGNVAIDTWKMNQKLWKVIAPGKTKMCRKKKHNHGSLFNSEVGNKYMHNNVSTKRWVFLVKEYCRVWGQVLSYDTRGQMLILHWFQNVKIKIKTE